MSEYTVLKDTDQTLDETIVGKNLTSATISWGLVAIGTDLSGDLDELTLLLEKTTDGGGITITDGPGGVFRVNFDPGDHASIRPDDYWVIRRVTLSGGDVLALPKYTITLGT